MYEPRKLKRRQRGPYCQYCEGKTRATHRAYDFQAFACKLHANLLEAFEPRNEHQNEAMDYIERLHGI